jgi:hypothetical protein
VRVREQESHPGGVVGHAQLPEGAHGIVETGDGRGGVALGEHHRAAGGVGLGPEAERAVPRRDRRELVGAAARAPDVVRGDRDLDGRGQQPGARQRLLGGGLERARDARRGSLAAALREPQQGEARAGIAPEPVGRAVGLLRRGQLAALAPQVAERVVRLTDHRGQEAAQVVDHAPGLGLGVAPLAARLEDLGAVDAADAHEGAGAGHRLAPAQGRLGPLARAAPVREPPAGEHEVAVDVACPSRIELVGGRAEHRLVEQRHPALHLALGDQHASLGQHAERDERRVVEAPARLEHLARALARRLEVRAVERVLVRDVDDVAPLRAGPLVREQPLGPPQPARALRRVAADHARVADVERYERCRPRRAVVDVAPVGALERGQRLVQVAEPPRAVRERVEVVAGERAALRCLTEALARHDPVARAVRPARGLEQLALTGRGPSHRPRLNRGADGVNRGPEPIPLARLRPWRRAMGFRTQLGDVASPSWARVEPGQPKAARDAHAD